MSMGPELRYKKKCYNDEKKQFLRENEVIPGKRGLGVKLEHVT